MTMANVNNTSLQSDSQSKFIEWQLQFHDISTTDIVPDIIFFDSQ